MSSDGVSIVCVYMCEWLKEDDIVSDSAKMRATLETNRRRVENNEKSTEMIAKPSQAMNSSLQTSGQMKSERNENPSKRKEIRGME